ncbi:MAG: reverse transcriptase domain-containing protein, partial [Alistipes senegalensis]|nr:reverse transcriptase domain-containing protein [Alistipes senegalensis]
MADKILQMFFDIDRWTKAIEKGVDKDIRKDQLIRLTDEHTRLAMADAMKRGKYEISPPHTAQIPKDNGEFRTVYVNEPMDRVILSIANDLLFDLMPEILHPACKSYQTGIGCGKVVTEVSHRITSANRKGFLGWKSDLSKYFDSVPIQFIDEAFDKVEAKHGHSALIDVLRKYYHSDLYFDENNQLQSKFQSLKQGCAVASWLADVLLYDLDDELSRMNGYYVRYSDDMLFIGE